MTTDKLSQAEAQRATRSLARFNIEEGKLVSHPSGELVFYDRVKEIAATDAQGVQQWLPIETAPKDAKRIMLFFPSFGEYGHERIEFGRWDLDSYAKKPRPYWTGDNERLFGVLAYRGNPPTHWMPKPPSPSLHTEPPAAVQGAENDVEAECRKTCTVCWADENMPITCAKIAVRRSIDASQNAGSK